MTSPTIPRHDARALVGLDLSKSYAGRPVLDGIDVVAAPGRVLALVGENGAGKSTLLRVLAGEAEPDAGTVRRPADVGYLGQSFECAPGTLVGDVLHDALLPMHRATERIEVLAARLDEPGAAQEYADLLDWATAHDAWDADRRALEAAARLGLAQVDPGRSVDSLSGGQRSRLALAALLTRRPGCLLLDEPTNHLDDQAAAFLETVLKELPGVVVVASHDRMFIDAVADSVLDLDPSHFGSDGSGGRVHGTSTGGYAAFLAGRTAARERWKATYGQQQDELRELRRVATTTARQVAHDRPPRDNDKFIYHAKGANVQRTVRRRVRDTERRLEALESDQVPKPPEPLHFDGRLAPGAGGAVQVRDLVVPGRLRLARLDVRPGERLLVTGPNGCGKSTLLKVLAARLGDRAQVQGVVSVRAARVGYLPQDVRFPDPGRSAASVYAAAASRGRRLVPLGELGLVHPRDAHRPVGELSLGQQRRLALAVLVAREPDLVLLDEPTNHVSPALAEELEQALERSAGTVVVASHDRWLRRRWSADHLAL